MYLSRTLIAISGLMCLTSAAPAAVEQRAGLISPFPGGESGPAAPGGGLGKQGQRPKLQQPQKAPAEDTTSTITTTTFTTVTIPPETTETAGAATAAEAEAEADITASLGSEPETLTLVVGDNDGSVITVAPASPATTASVT